MNRHSWCAIISTEALRSNCTCPGLPLQRKVVIIVTNRFENDPVHFKMWTWVELYTHRKKPSPHVFSSSLQYYFYLLIYTYCPNFVNFVICLCIIISSETCCKLHTTSNFWHMKPRAIPYSFYMDQTLLMCLYKMGTKGGTPFLLSTKAYGLINCDSLQLAIRSYIRLF